MATAMATAIADDDAIDAPWAVVSDALDGDADVWSEEDSNARAERPSAPPAAPPAAARGGRSCSIGSRLAPEPRRAHAARVRRRLRAAAASASRAMARSRRRRRARPFDVHPRHNLLNRARLNTACLLSTGGRVAAVRYDAAARRPSGGGSACGAGVRSRVRRRRRRRVDVRAVRGPRAARAPRADRPRVPRARGACCDTAARVHACTASRLRAQTEYARAATSSARGLGPRPRGPGRADVNEARAAARARARGRARSRLSRARARVSLSLASLAPAVSLPRPDGCRAPRTQLLFGAGNAACARAHRARRLAPRHCAGGAWRFSGRARRAAARSCSAAAPSSRPRPRSPPSARSRTGCSARSRGARRGGRS